VVRGRNRDDFYVTPAWATRALIGWLPPHLRIGLALDVCCGTGAIGREFLDSPATSCRVAGIELDAERASVCPFPVALGDAEDVLMGDGRKWLTVAADGEAPNLLVANPPFAHAERIVEAMLDEMAHGARGGVAVLLRSTWLLAKSRRRFATRWGKPDIGFLSPRVSFTADGKTDSTEYAWFMWGVGDGGRWAILERRESA
jgi:methylase of polypeptide subunit release factors